MFLKFLLFGLSCCYLNVVHGLEDQSRLIAKRILFKGDVIEIAISNLQVNDPEQSKVPLMMISVMKDTTLGYDIEPFSPFVKEKVPVLDLHAAENNRGFILSPSTVALKIDFQTKTLINDPFSSLIDLYPNTSSIFRDNTSVSYEAEKLIEMTSFELNGTVLYDFTFAFPIDTVESEGLYKIYFHSHTTIEMESRWKVSSVGILWRLSVTEMLCFVRIFLFVVNLFIWLYLLTNIKGDCLPDYLELLVAIAFVSLFVRTMIVFIQLFNIVRRKEMPEQLEPIIDLPALILSTILNLTCMAVVLCCCLFCWKKWCRTDVFHKIDKALYTSIWLYMIYYLHNNYSSSDDSSILTSTGNSFLFLQSTLIMLKTSDTEWEIVVIDGFRKRFWRTRCIYAGCFFIVSFKLVLVTMTWLEVPFYFYFIQIVIEDLLSFLPLWITVESTRYYEYLYYNPYYLAAAA